MAVRSDSLVREGIKAASLAVVLGLVLAGCSGGQGQPQEDPSGPWSSGLTEEQIIEKAKGEGELRLYTNQPDATQQVLNDAFTAKYGIPVTSQRLVGAEFDTKVQTELDTGQVAVDLLIGTNQAAFDTWHASDKLADLPLSAMTADDAWPDDFVEDYMVAISANIYGVLYNKNTVTGSAIPKTWDDLLKPAVAGKLYLIDPLNGVAAVLPYNTLLEDEDYGEDYLSALSKQGTFVQTGVTAINNMGAGAGDYFAPAPSAFLSTIAAGNLPIGTAWLSPSPLVGSWSAIPTSAANPYAAALFLDFTMSVEGQAVLNKGGFTAIPGVPGVAQFPSDVEIVPADYDATTANLSKITGLMGR